MFWIYKNGTRITASKESRFFSQRSHLSGKMRNIIGILALLCTVYALEQDVLDLSRNLERLVNIQKTATETILNDLSLFEEQKKQNLKMKLDELKTIALLDIWFINGDAVGDVNSLIKKGREEGKKVDECYNYATNNLETNNQNDITGVETCVQNGYTVMEAPLANVASNIEAANKLVFDLDAIIPNCNSASFLKMQACVVKNLFLTGLRLKRISNNAKEVMTIATVTYGKTIIDVRSCTTKIIADARTSSMNIVIQTDNCITNAPINSTPATSAAPITSVTATTVKSAA